MSKDIETRLRAAHIPENALVTTLAKEGQTHLRQMILDGAFEYEYKLYDKPQIGNRGALFLPNTQIPYWRLTLIANLFAKELVLAGYNRVKTVSLSSILDSIEYRNDWEMAAYRGHTIIRETFLEGQPSPFDPRHLHRFQSRVMELMDEGYAFTFVAATHMDVRNWDWYGGAFLSKIQNECVQVEVECQTG